jgi:hypothetical protein
MNCISQRRNFWSRARTGIGLMGVAVALTASVARAQISNVIWKASFAGTLNIQEFDANLNPRQQSAGFNTSAFLRMVSGTAQTSNQVLSVSVSFLPNSPTGTIVLAIYDTTARQNTLPTIGTNSSSVVLYDGTNYVFTADIPMPPPSPTSTWQGGFLKLAGRASAIRGTPVRLQASAEGFFIDLRPSDIGGTTGILTRATISTVGAPLRVQPIVVP